MARLIRARATVNLERFPVGTEADVDPADPRTLALLRSGLLVSDEWWDEPPPQVREPQQPKPQTPPGTATVALSGEAQESEDEPTVAVTAGEQEGQTETAGPR